MRFVVMIPKFKFFTPNFNMRGLKDSSHIPNHIMGLFDKPQI